MRRIASLVLLASAAACAEAPTSPLAADAMLASRGAAEPRTVVSAVAEVRLAEGGAGSYRESGPGNNGKGECRATGVWYNPETRRTSGAPHAQCWDAGSGERVLTVSFSGIATYVLARSGNVQLNFDADAMGVDRFLHYKAQQDATGGAGILVGSDNEGGTWTIDLAQPLVNASTNLIDGTGTELLACNATHGCHSAVMTW